MGRWARSLTSWGLRVASVKRQLRDANSVFAMRAVSRIVAPRYGLGLTTISTRRLACRPSSASFEATGMVEPNPVAAIFLPRNSTRDR